MAKETFAVVSIIMNKILFFGTYFHPYLSGITTYPNQILSVLAEDHDITVLTFRHQKVLKKQEQYHGLTIKRMDFWLRVSKGFLSPQSWFCFLKEVRRHDVVLLNIPNAEGLPLALLAKICGKKIIAIYHCQVSFERSWLNKIAAFLLNASISLQLLIADEIVAYTQDYVQSKMAGKLLADKFSYALPPVQKLAVDTEFHQQLMSKKGNGCWVGFAGRVAREKGLAYLIEALARLDYERPIKLMLAGPYGADVVGEADYYQRILALLKKHNVDYHFFGSLNNGKLGAFYQAIDVLALPSVNQTEAFGMVQAEAMLAGTPVVTTNLPGVRRLVQLTGMGKIVPVRNVEQLSRAIEQIISDSSSYTLSKKRKTVEKLFAQQPALQLMRKLISS